MKKSTIIYGIVLTVLLFAAIVLYDSQKGEIHWLTDGITSIAIFILTMYVSVWKNKKRGE